MNIAKNFNCGKLNFHLAYIIFSIREVVMPWVTFDLNQFKGRAVSEDEYPNYFHRKDDDGVAEDEQKQLEEPDDEE